MTRPVNYDGFEFRCKRQGKLVYHYLVGCRDRLMYPLYSFDRDTLPLSHESDKRLVPFYILGSPRSGTTLLREILNRHPALFIPPENGRILSMIQIFVATRGQSWHQVVNAVFCEFEKGYEAKYWNVDKQEVIARTEKIPPEKRSLASIFNCLYCCCAENYISAKVRWGDKSTPGNFNYLDKLAKVFPNSKYIHIVRDGRDCVASCIKAKFYDSSYSRAAYAWLDNVRACRRFGTQIGPNNFLSIQYEKLLADPEKVIRQVCVFLDENYSSTMLLQSGQNQAVSPDIESIAHHSNVRKPISKESIGKWRRDLPQEKIDKVAAIVRSELNHQGYC